MFVTAANGFRGTSRIRMVLHILRSTMTNRTKTLQQTSENLLTESRHAWDGDLVIPWATDNDVLFLHCKAEGGAIQRTILCGVKAIRLYHRSLFHLHGNRNILDTHFVIARIHFSYKKVLGYVPKQSS